MQYKNVEAVVDYQPFITKGKQYRVEVLPSDSTGNYGFDAYRVNTDDGGFRVLKSFHFKNIKK